MIKFIDCHSKSCHPADWTAELNIIKIGNPTEVYISANGNSYHVLTGTHEQGNYLCIPDWSIGSELSSWSDRFWNAERLRNYCSLDKAESETIAQVLLYLAPFIMQKESD